MTSKRVITILGLALAVVAGALVGLRPASAHDEDKKGKSLEELRLSAYAELDGDESVFHIKGWAYGFIPGQRPMRLFGLEGYNIRRYVPVEGTDGDLYLASREILFYTDPESGEVLSEWHNPYTDQTVEVFHIHNDPVNFRFNKKGDMYVGAMLDGSREFGPSPPPVEFTDYYVWYADVFPFYPLPGWEKNYTAGELFDFYVPKSGRFDDGPFETMNSWTRIGPWLPWMQMDGHEGLMVYHARARRLRSWDQLPEWVRQRVTSDYPLYRHAPESVDPSLHNATSWSVYMKEIKERAMKEEN